jgi:crotonobetainyl-CoA:carnitine CoA-transferase CaiB-like acyl-CoA transferase
LDERFEARFIETRDDHAPAHGEGHRPPAQRDQLVVRTRIKVDIAFDEPHALAGKPRFHPLAGRSTRTGVDNNGRGHMRASDHIASPAPSDPPLVGVTVLDLTRVLSGPYCTMLLADMGARVIKIEQPGLGDDTRHWGPPFVGGESAYFLSINRNKESVTVNFKHPEGRRLIEHLAARADVLVENFRPGTLDRLGLGYRALAARAPRLVYCSISGFGLNGPERDRPGYDAVVQAESGLMSLTGPEHGPPYRLGVAVADLVAGLFAAQGILLALWARQRTGRGQLVDISMLDSTMALLTYQAEIFLTTGQVPRRLGNRHPTIVPYETFDATDGEFVVAVGNDAQWQRFCEAIGLTDLAADPRFATNPARVEAYETLRPLLAAHLASRPKAEWIAQLASAGVPCGAVRAVDEALSSPQVSARQMVVEVDHATIGTLRVLGVPVKLSATPGAVRRPPPRLGEHTDAVLAHDLGLDAAEIARLRREGVV